MVDIGAVIGLAPVYEYLLQGSVTDKMTETLLHRLEGLTDYREGGRETFYERESVYSMESPEMKHPMTLRLRKALDMPDLPVHVRYLGADTEDKKRLTLIRSCIELSASQNVDTFLQEMGFKTSYEYVLKGHIFHRGRMKVTVSKISRMNQSHGTDGLEPVSGSHLVELSLLATTGQVQSTTDQIQEDMRNFADQVKPLVSLERLDHRKLQTTPQR